MASVIKRIAVCASAEAAWDAIRDIGALHTRLVPGFVIETKLEPGLRIVTFANGWTIREPIVACDETERRLVWTSQGGRTSHYNASLQVFDEPGGATIVWIADFLPDETKDAIDAAMNAGAAAMRSALGAGQPAPQTACAPAPPASGPSPDLAKARRPDQP